MAGCSQERCSKAVDGHYPSVERRDSNGVERVVPCAAAYALDPCRRRSLGPTLELFVSFRPVAVLSWRLDMCLHASGNDDLGGRAVRREAAAPCRRGSWALPEPAGRARGDLYTRAAGRRGQHEQG